MSRASRGLSAETVFAVARLRAVVRRSPRSYAAPRGRTQLRAVVPSCARSYLRRDLRYDRAHAGTAARMRVRPRGLRYDPRGAVATTRRRTARTAQPDTTAGTGRAFGPTLGIGRDVPIARSSVRPVGFRRRAQFPQRAGCIRLHCNSVTWHCSSITHHGSVETPQFISLTSRRASHALCC